MFVDGLDEFYYVTIDNENEVQPPMPQDHDRVRDGVMRGMYLFQPAEDKKAKLQAQLLAGGPAMGAALEAAELLKKYGVAASIWSVTSYKELHQDALLSQRWNMLHPTEAPKSPMWPVC
ncbi:transketolase-like TK C-terminal-containing protein [Deinococcus radiophilus]|uniref:transketolase-like TK C-terminal-containing protein n=1 Tax=Deinococcus radiophilus TaxID=32062 RepID=UPI00360B5F3E